ncbi:LysR family transcriptional regulator [Mitsuokella sp. oral taxon 131]|uniref:LysR family transcriptional regulator n=1 Tax=Mitsuokella sp. oral taxon 131 TaxID=1321780 RepID=UPI0003ADA8C9|nr:LysR family transcriptional regulator [Mitsuokella sp. oral taxon 131]ERL05050.1 LysR substrate binding domain protein [Mitsuokella sp. oral taxon 131 str. W9106]
MELRLLRYFLATTEEGNITAAARVLRITQPTLSRQLTVLEDELGKKLLIRGRRKLRLTEDGIYFQKHAQEIVTLADKLEHSIKGTSETIHGDVFIGGGESDAMRLIAQAIKRLRAGYPQVHYHLFSGNADDVEARLENGLLDFGLLIGPADTERYDTLPLPIRDTWGILMRRDHPLANEPAIEAKDLAGIPLIIPERKANARRLKEWAGEDVFSNYDIFARHNLIFSASLLVSEGAGVAITLDRLIYTDGTDLVFRPLFPLLQSELVLIWKKYQAFSPAARLLMGELRGKLLNQD